MANNNIQKLFGKKMNRKEFLAHIGAGVLVVSGMSGLLKSLVNYHTGHSQSVSGDYGYGDYGGRKDN
jgi:hypothetical protein